MRYDTKIYFQRRVPGAYISDPRAENFGDYEEDSVSETMCFASVTSMTAKAQNLIFGSIREDAVAVHLQNRYEEPFDSVRIGNWIYAESRRSELRVKGILYLSGRKEAEQ